MIENPYTPLMIVVSAPSGAGKTSLCDRLLAEDRNIRYSTSCTTRPPRSGEVDGKAYHFLAASVFAEKKSKGDFLESADVHGHCYGTLRETISDLMAQGHDVLMDVDFQGANQLREMIQQLEPSHPIRLGYVDVFIAPPSLHALKERLVNRKSDDASAIELRMKNAVEEIKTWHQYQYLLINDQFDLSLEKFRSIVQAERLRVR